MVYKIEITILAEEEFASAIHFYEEQQPGLGGKFVKETDKMMDILKANPYLFQRKYKHYREAVYKRFPYFLVYEIIDDLVIILSFFHTSRNPKKKLKGRT